MPASLLKVIDSPAGQGLYAKTLVLTYIVSIFSRFSGFSAFLKSHLTVLRNFRYCVIIKYGVGKIILKCLK